GIAHADLRARHEPGDGILPEGNGDLRRAVAALLHLRQDLPAALAGLRVHAQDFRPLDLAAVGTEVLADLLVPGEHRPRVDVSPGVRGVRLDVREPGDVDVVALED